MNEQRVNELLRIGAVFDALKGIGRIKELDLETSLRYMESTYEDTIGALVGTHDVIVVVGGYFGDEGKGKWTDAIAEDERIVIVGRDNSGDNAGHTVKKNGVKAVFNLTPSAIGIPGKTCVIGPECVMDPVSYFEREVSNLRTLGIEYMDRLFIGNTHIVGPHHKILDFVLSRNNASTLQGMSYVHASKAMKKGLRLNDLFNGQDAMKDTIAKDLFFYDALIAAKHLDESSILAKMEESGRRIPAHVTEFLQAKDKAGFLIDLYTRRVVQNPDFPRRADTIKMTWDALDSGRKILLEGPQSYWLSNATQVHWPTSTSAQTHAAGILASANINPRYRTLVINVMKTPEDSRVGLGANPSSFVQQDYFSSQDIKNKKDLGDKCADFDAIQRTYFGSIGENGILTPNTYTDDTGTYCVNEAMAIASSKKFDECGATTGKPRVTGVFDCVAAQQVNRAQGPHLVVSALDRGDSHDLVGMTVGYVYHHPQGTPTDTEYKTYRNGDIIVPGDPLPEDAALRHCHSIIKVMPGWKDTPLATRRPGDTIPANVERFLGNIEILTGFRILGFGNGAESENAVYIKRK